MILYLCSSSFIARREADFVSRWVEAMRASASPLREAALLIRPHPQNVAQWKSIDLRQANVAIFPRGGANPVDAETRADDLASTRSFTARRSSASTRAG